LPKNFLWDESPEWRIRFQNSFNIEQIFSPLRGSPRGIGGSPDFALQNILDRGDWKVQAQDITHRCAFHKIAVTRVGLDLNAKIGAGR
jgi:hypothetical protein